MRKKLILFDWGNIVESHMTGFSCSDAWDELFKRCGYNGKEKVSNLLSKYKLSSITNNTDFENVFNQMAKEFNLKVSYRQFVSLYKEIFHKIDYYKNVADYEVSLKKDCSIGIFSNLTIFDKQRLDKQVNLSKYDYVFLSYEFGCRKPESSIYQKVQEQLPFNKEDILFIDDNPENVRVAKEFGWNAYQATGLELDKIKIIVNNFLNK